MKQSDILVENYLPGKLASMKLGYEHLREVNPALIYCSISGYGQTGPYSKRGGYDVIASAMFGLMHITGEPNGAPVKAGVALTDLSTGLYCQGAIMAALLQRMRTGVGQKIEASLLNTQIAVLSHIATNFLTANKINQKQGTAHESIVPYQGFETRDNKFFIVGAGNNKQFRQLVKIMKLNESMADDTKFSTNSERVKNRKELIDILQTKFRQESVDTWISIFASSDLPHGPVNDMKAVFEDER